MTWRECLEPLGYYTTMRRIFERQIRYWELRPMENDPAMIVSPADARLLIGSFPEAEAPSPPQPFPSSSSGNVSRGRREMQEISRSSWGGQSASPDRRRRSGRRWPPMPGTAGWRDWPLDCREKATTSWQACSIKRPMRRFNKSILTSAVAASLLLSAFPSALAGIITCGREGKIPGRNSSARCRGGLCTILQ